MARFYYLRRDWSKKEANETARSLAKHLKQFALPTGIKIVKVVSKKGTVLYEMYTRATPKQIDTLHALLNRPGDLQWEGKRLSKKELIDLRGTADTKFKKRIFRLKRRSVIEQKQSHKRFKDEYTRIAGARRRS